MTAMTAERPFSGEMLVPDHTGHSRISWDKNVADEVEVARNSFEALIKKGYRAFRVNSSDAQGERMSTFDPTAEKIMMVPQLQGG